MRKISYKIVMIVVIVTALFGCTFIKDEIFMERSNREMSERQSQAALQLVQEWAAEDKAYDKEHNIKHRIDRWNDPLVLGMTTQKVYEKWGSATRDGESFSASGHLLVWKYGASWSRDGTYFPADTYLYFLDNKLINIIKMR